MIPAQFIVVYTVKLQLMKRILVPTDFSPNAEKALNFAVQIAKKAGAELFLVHAVEAYDEKDDMASAKEKLGLVSKSILDTESMEITTGIVSDSSVNGILDAIAEYRADLVVMGTMGNTGFNERIFGSRTAVVIGKSPVPVLAIPLLSEWKAPEKILVAVNRFEGTDELLKPVIGLASVFNAGIQLTIFTDADDDYVEDYKLHEKKISAFRDSLKDKYPNLVFNAVHLSGLHFRKSLQQWIDDNNVDWLVMLTHRRTLIGSVFNSSMTKKMSYHTNIPLLAIPEG